MTAASHISRTAATEDGGMRRTFAAVDAVVIGSGQINQRRPSRSATLSERVTMPLRGLTKGFGVRAPRRRVQGVHDLEVPFSISCGRNQCGPPTRCWRKNMSFCVAALEYQSPSRMRHYTFNG